MMKAVDMIGSSKYSSDSNKRRRISQPITNKYRMNSVESSSLQQQRNQKILRNVFIANRPPAFERRLNRFDLFNCVRTSPLGPIVIVRCLTMLKHLYKRFGNRMQVLQNLELPAHWPGLLETSVQFIAFCGTHTPHQPVFEESRQSRALRRSLPVFDRLANEQVKQCVICS